MLKISHRGDNAFCAAIARQRKEVFKRRGVCKQLRHTFFLQYRLCFAVNFGCFYKCAQIIFKECSINEKKPFSRTLSLALSLMLAFGCFAVVPASAVAVDEKGTVGNVTLVDYGQENNSLTQRTFDQKIAKLNVESQYTGTNLKLTGISNPWLAANYPKAENRIVGAKYRAALAESYAALSSANLAKSDRWLDF